MAEAIKYLYLNDFEILGVGALRKHSLRPENNPSAMVLKTHDHSFLPGLLEQTIEWLKPQHVVNESSLVKPTLLKQAFFRIFPLGTAWVGASAESLLNDFLAEMPWEEGLLEDHFRYFSFFYRRLFPRDRPGADIFLWEWIQNSLTYQDFGDETPSRFSAAENRLKLNPSLQVHRLEQASSLLNRDRGLYVFVYSPRFLRVIEKKLDPEQSAILDLLAEDRKFSKEQILEMRFTEKASDKGQILSSLELLLEQDIIRE